MNSIRELIRSTFPVILLLVVVISVTLLVSIMIPILVPIAVVGIVVLVAYLWFTGGWPVRLPRKERRDYDDGP